MSVSMKEEIRNTEASAYEGKAEWGGHSDVRELGSGAPEPTDSIDVTHFRKNRKQNLALLSIGEGKEIYPEPPVKSLKLDVSASCFMMISRFDSAPGALLEACFQSWRLITNLAKHALPLSIVIHSREEVYVRLQPDESLLLGPGVRSSWRWGVPANFRLVELPQHELIQLAKDTFATEIKGGPALLRFSSVRGGLFNDTYDCMKRGNEGHSDIAKALSEIARIRLLRKMLENTNVSTLGYSKWSLLNIERVHSTRTHKSVRRALDILHAVPCQQISVADLAEEVGVSRQHFQSIFMKDVGESPARYLRRIQLERAIHLIRIGETIAQVANNCGFSDQAHLTRAVKSFTGKTPTQLT